MKINNWTKKLSATLAAGGALVGAHEAGAVTTLTGLTSTNDPVPADHGSNAAGTPNIALVWDADWDQYDGWPNDPGDGVYQHDNGLGSPHTIDFVPDAGWNVSLTSLDTNVWPGGGDTDISWSVDGSVSGNLGAGTFSTLDGTVVAQSINLSGSGGETVTLSLDQTSGVASYLAIDNLTFDQVVVPEPTTTALALLGLGGLGAAAMRKERK